MSEFKSAASRLAKVIPLVCFVAVVNLFICFIVSGFIMLQLISFGLEKHLALVISIAIAIGIHFYISYNYRIRQIINKPGVID